MKKTTRVTIAAILVCLAVSIGFLLFPKHASDINNYNTSAIIAIEINDNKSDSTININDAAEIQAIIDLLRNDYAVREIDKAREQDILVSNPPLFTVTLLTGDFQPIADQYIVTSFNTIMVSDMNTMFGSERTEMYESVKAHPEILEALRTFMNESR